MRRLPALLLLILLLLASPRPARAHVGGEFEAQEEYVAAHPGEVEPHRRLAAAYSTSGFVEEAMEQYVALLRLAPDDRAARAAAAELLMTRMPAWLPAEAAEVKPFPLDALSLALPGGPDYAFLFTPDGLAAHAGERLDRLRGWSFPRLVYGYVRDPAALRWQLRVRVHYPESQAALAQATLKTTLALYGAVRGTLGFDPTKGKGPLDVWLCEQGPPGAFGAGASIYLQAVATEREPSEWLRELAHEYGHTALPGLGGFTRTDDPWADGELGELLFVKYLAAAKADWLPWPAAPAEAAARVRREELIARAPKPNAKLLAGVDAKARDHLLGLAI